MMKHWILGAIVVGLTATMVVTDADAKRLGGSKSSGAQRQTPSQPVQKAPSQPDSAAPQATPNPGPAAGAVGAAAVPTAAAAAKAGAPAAAQAAKRSWTGPVMGLAAGLGLAALFSHFGMGEAFSSIMMMLLLAMVGFVLFRFIASRFGKRGAVGAAGGLAAAGASAAGGSTGFERRSFDTVPNAPSSTGGTSGITIGSALQPAAAGGHDLATSDARRLSADFDTQAFERAAKTIFIRLQAANDGRNLDDLRAFSTPEMFAELRADLLDRGDRTQHTDVISVNPTIVDFADEGRQRVVSVRYVGVIREDAGANAEPFDEVWHLVQNSDSPAWRIAGIQQNG